MVDALGPDLTLEVDLLEGHKKARTSMFSVLAGVYVPAGTGIEAGGARPGAGLYPGNMAFLSFSSMSPVQKCISIIVHR